MKKLMFIILKWILYTRKSDTSFHQILKFRQTVQYDCNIWVKRHCTAFKVTGGYIKVYLCKNNRLNCCFIVWAILDLNQPNLLVSNLRCFVLQWVTWFLCTFFIPGFSEEIKPVSRCLRVVDTVALCMIQHLSFPPVSACFFVIWFL